MTAHDKDVIRASEVGEYAYCARAWWLSRVKGVRSSNWEALEQGTKIHEAHGRVALAASRLQTWAYILLTVAVCASLILLWRLVV